MNEIRDMEKQISDGIDKAHKQSVVDAMVANAEQSIVRAEKIQAAFDALDSTAAVNQLSFLRGHIDELSKRVIVFRKSEINHACDCNEVRANLTLAYRHLEDARMRLGKAIQAIDGGVSCYDKNPQSV